MGDAVVGPVRLSASFWQSPVVLRALGGRDISVLFQQVSRRGVSQTRLGTAVGLSQGQVSEIARGTRRIARLHVLERIADGLSMPDHACALLGLAPRGGDADQATVRRQDEAGRTDSLRQHIHVPVDVANSPARGMALAASRPGAKHVNSERAYELYQRGYSLLASNDKRRVDAATDLLDAALDVDPQFARAQAARGYAEWRQYFAGWASDGSTLQRALADVDSAMQLEPESIGAHTTLIRICWDMGWHERALEAGRSIYRRNPQSLDATLAYARALNNAGLAELALPLTSNVLRVDPTNPTALKLLIWNYLMVRNYEAALDTAVEYLPAYPRDSNTRWAVAMTHLCVGAISEAVRIAQEAVDADPDDLTAWNLLGYLHRQLGDDGFAVTAWRQGIDHAQSQMSAGRNPRLQSWLANLRAASGQTAEARETVSWLTKTEPQNGYIKYRATHVLAELGEIDSAVSLLGEASRDGFRSIQILRHEERLGLAKLVESEKYRVTVAAMENRVAQLKESHQQSQ